MIFKTLKEGHRAMKDFVGQDFAAFVDSGKKLMLQCRGFKV